MIQRSLGLPAPAPPLPPASATLHPAPTPPGHRRGVAPAGSAIVSRSRSRCFPGLQHLPRTTRRTRRRAPRRLQRLASCLRTSTTTGRACHVVFGARLSQWRYFETKTKTNQQRGQVSIRQRQACAHGCCERTEANGHTTGSRCVLDGQGGALKKMHGGRTF